MKYILSENQLKFVVNSILLDESTHSEKFLPEVFKYIKKYMGCEISDTTNGYKICPPPEITVHCWKMHRGDKGVFDLLRYLSEHYGLSKHVLEMGIRNNEKFEKIKEKSKSKGYSPK